LSPQVPRGLARALSLFLFFVAALDHFYSNDFYLNQRNTAPSLSWREKPVRPLPVRPPLARRVWVLVLDGLGFDAALSTPGFSALAAQGALRPLAVEFPSFTYPGITALSSGVPPFWSGVRLNEARTAPALPTIQDAARAAGLAVYLSPGGWDELPGLLDPVSPWVSLPGLCRLPAVRSLSWLYVGEIDAAGHRGGTSSAAYQSAARSSVALASLLARCLDLTQDTLVIVSDHGHLAGGGHGGDEPEVLRALFLALGAGVRAGARLDTRAMIDVPSTIAALLGIAPPRADLGHPMLDALDLSWSARAQQLAPSFAQRAAQESPPWESAALLARLETGEVSAYVLAEGYCAMWEAARSLSRRAEAEGRAVWRLSCALLVLAVLLLGVVWLHRRWLGLCWGDGLPLVAYSVTFFVLYWLTGNRIGWSIPRGEAVFLLETLVYGVLAANVALWVSRSRARLAQESLLLGLGLGIPYWLSSAWEGLDPVFSLGDAASFAVLLTPTFAFYGHLTYAVWLWRRSSPAAP
jgi:hypothetical protein